MNSDLYYQAFWLPTYYSFECAGAGFVILDTNAVDLSSQTAWLREGLDTGNAGGLWRSIIRFIPRIPATRRLD
jgi:hypothetical protein